jgi:hypothetical protein
MECRILRLAFIEALVIRLGELGIAISCSQKSSSRFILCSSLVKFLVLEL